MSRGQSPEAARALLAEVVDSFEKLEIVVHVYRAGFVVGTPAELASSIGASVSDVEQCLHVLHAERVLDPNGPRAAAVATLANMYDEDRAEVLDLLNKTALARVREEAARVFAPRSRKSDGSEP